jgi:hypothetical protein
MKAAMLGVTLILAACNRSEDRAIDPVPAPTDETGNRLMAGAQNAAADAQLRMERDGKSTPTITQSQTKGEDR